jgi:hypothetical protein
VTATRADNGLTFGDGGDSGGPTPMRSRALTKISATVCDIATSHANPPAIGLKREWSLIIPQIAAIAYYGIQCRLRSKADITVSICEVRFATVSGL